MKSLKNIFWILLFTTQLYGMEQPIELKQPLSLRKIAEKVVINTSTNEQIEQLKQENPHLIQQKPSLSKEELAQQILDVIKIQDLDQMNLEFAKFTEEEKFETALHFLGPLSKQTRKHEDNQFKRALIDNVVQTADISHLHLLRNKIFQYRISFFSTPRTIRETSELSNMAITAKWLDKLLNYCTQKIASKIQKLSILEQTPIFDLEAAQYLQSFIEKLDQENWALFNLELLKKAGIDSDLFSIYLFGIYIPSKNFSSPLSYADNCKAMITYITNILEVYTPENLSNLLSCLFKFNPLTTNMLFHIDTMIHKTYDRRWSNNAQFKIETTLLCPKLFLLHKLKNKFFNEQCSGISTLLNQDKINECAQKWCSIYYNIGDKRLIVMYMKNVIKLIINQYRVEKDRYLILEKLIEALTICLPQIKLEQDMKKDLCDFFSKIKFPTLSKEAKSLGQILENACNS